jgi:hypothetical protein
MRENSYCGAVEAGVITGPDSKANQIWRYNGDEPDREPELAQDRSLHQPFGKTDSV